MNRVILWAMLALAGVAGTGCIPTSLDRYPQMKERMLGSRYLVVRTLTPPDWTKELPLEAGTVVEVVHTERLDLLVHVDGRMYAKVRSGRYAGERIRLGTIWLNESEQTFTASVFYGGAMLRHGFLPMPEPAPAWVDTTVMPPKAKAAPMAELLEGMRHPRWETRFWAIRGLAAKALLDRTSIEGVEAIEALQIGSTDSHPDVRQEAAEGLYDLGLTPRGGPVMPRYPWAQPRD